MEDLQPTPEELARIVAENTLSTLAAKTSFGAIPKIMAMGQKRVDEIIKAASGINVVDAPTLIKLFNGCLKEAERADIVFNGVVPKEIQNDSDRQIWVELRFTVPRKIQIFDVFSIDKIYRIPYEVFHPDNITIVVKVEMVECRLIYHTLSLFKQGGIPLHWVHVFPSGERGNLCLGSLSNAFTNEGLDGTFLTKLLSSLECLNLNSPARPVTEINNLESEYHKLVNDILNHAFKDWMTVSG